MVTDKFNSFIIGLTLLLLVWCIVANAYTLGFIDRSPLLLGTLFIFLAVGAHFLWKKTGKITGWVRRNKNWAMYMLGFFVIISIIFRLAFGLLEYAPVSDPASFFLNASNLASTGELAEPGYVAKFPYLYTYNVLLSGAMSWLGTTHMTVIILNIVLDLIAALFLYLLMRNNKASRLLAFTMAAIWMCNPFTVFFSVLSLPLALFNTLFMIILYLVHQIYLNAHRLKHLILYSCLAAVALALANSVRPVAAIFIIALTIFMLMIIIQNPKKKFLLGHFIIGWSLLIAIFTSLGNLQTNLVVRATDFPPTKNPGSWSIYVGTNLDYLGVWNYDDAAVSEKLVEEGYSPNESHDIFQQMAIERFSSYSLAEKAELVVGKAIVLGGDQKNGIYNLDIYPVIKDNPDTYSLFKVAAAVFSWTMIAISALLFYRVYQQKSQSVMFVHYLALVFIGLFVASLLVEVANRYFAPFFVLLVIFAGLVFKAYVDNYDKQITATVK